MESKFENFMTSIKPLGNFIIKVIIGTIIAGAIIMFIEYNNYNMNQYFPTMFQTQNKMITTDLSIKNHLLWNKQGECYFVEFDKSLVQLIRVSDCDRS